MANKLVPRPYKKELSVQIFRIAFCRVYLSFYFYKTSKLQTVCVHPQKRPQGLMWHKTTFFGKTKCPIFSNLSKWIPWPGKHTYQLQHWWKMVQNKNYNINSNFQTPLGPSSSNFCFLGGTFSFFGRIWWKRCQNAQGYILLHMRWSPKEFETWPFFYPCIAHLYKKIWYYWLYQINKTMKTVLKKSTSSCLL